ncbi:MAG: molecular chaperone TorD family protein [Desulfobacteraceae bacterium]|nr:molecular chaperone TorD family protein [Desulfobacteraceae bacterium]
MDIENFKDKRLETALLDGVQIMCKLFWGPDLDSCRHMIKGNYFKPFEIIFIESGKKPSGTLDNINSIINGFDSFQSLLEHLNECYVRLFVNSKEGITSPLYESCYEFENAPMMGKAALLMKERFESKGLSMENRVHEPPDHLAIELEYLFFLLQENVGPDDNPAAFFAEKTMLPWVIVFNQRLKLLTDDCKFYSLASTILVLLLEQISNRK